MSVWQAICQGLLCALPGIATWRFLGTDRGDAFLRRLMKRNFKQYNTEYLESRRKYERVTAGINRIVMARGGYSLGPPTTPTRDIALGEASTVTFDNVTHLIEPEYFAITACALDIPVTDKPWQKRFIMRDNTDQPITCIVCMTCQTN